jgi:hypothetical protein
MDNCQGFLCYNFTAMNVIALAVLLAVMQAPSPVPRKAANPSNGTAHDIKSRPSGDQAPSQTSPTVLKPINSDPNKNESKGPTTENRPQSIVVPESISVSVTKDWLDKIYIGCTAVLVIIGSIGVRAAYKTLQSIKTQASEMKTQRETMQGQLTIMQSQLTEMQGGANQTAELIRHAGNQAGALIGVAAAICMQTEETKAIGRAANASAEAARMPPPPC